MQEQTDHTLFLRFITDSNVCVKKYRMCQKCQNKFKVEIKYFLYPMKWKKRYQYQT